MTATPPPPERLEGEAAAPVAGDDPPDAEFPKCNTEPAQCELLQEHAAQPPPAVGPPAAPTGAARTRRLRGASVAE
eukprot:gene6101-1946_t